MKLFSSKVKEDDFIVFFKRHAGIGVECSKALSSLFRGGGSESFKLIDKLEHEGDKLCTDVHKLVDRTFIPLFDKPDILALTNYLDNIPDTMKTIGRKMVIFNLDKSKERESCLEVARRFCQCIEEATLELLRVVDQLPRFDHDGLRASVLKINALEDKADDLLDESLARLFNDLNAPVTVSMALWSEVFHLLESVTDHCQDAADTLMSIARKEGH
ncbi:MAG: DUF47 family protein [Candidatus Eremiobacteraeota bacterium]|nr:DUF47 family protein [Candidatus Eremiobacteraeota bacterium]